jgi:hypothetical protein
MNANVNRKADLELSWDRAEQRAGLGGLSIPFVVPVPPGCSNTGVDVEVRP